MGRGRLPGRLASDVRGDGAQDGVDVPGVECVGVPAADPLVHVPSVRDLSVALRERSMLPQRCRRGRSAPFARSPADAPEIAVSFVGRNRMRLQTIVVVPLGRLAAGPEPGLCDA
jgi:hypothetical protein